MASRDRHGGRRKKLRTFSLNGKPQMESKMVMRQGYKLWNPAPCDTLPPERPRLLNQLHQLGSGVHRPEPMGMLLIWIIMAPQISPSQRFCRTTDRRWQHSQVIARDGKAESLGSHNLNAGQEDPTTEKIKWLLSSNDNVQGRFAQESLQRNWEQAAGSEPQIQVMRK